MTTQCMHRDWPLLPLASLIAVFLLVAAAPARAYIGTFNPERHDYRGPQLVTFVDSNAAPVQCIGLAAEKGDLVTAVLGLVAPMTACTHVAHDDCTIIAPISAGVGQVFAAVAAFAGPNALLGHEFRHCRDHYFHADSLPFAEASQ